MPSDGHKHFREKIVARWDRKGGVLLLTTGLFIKMMGDEKFEKALVSTDAIILDER